MQRRRNSIANALELRLSCTYPSMYHIYIYIYIGYIYIRVDSRDYSESTHKTMAPPLELNMGVRLSSDLICILYRSGLFNIAKPALNKQHRIIHGDPYNCCLHWGYVTANFVPNCQHSRYELSLVFSIWSIFYFVGKDHMCNIVLYRTVLRRNLTFYRDLNPHCHSLYL